MTSAKKKPTKTRVVVAHRWYRGGGRGSNCGRGGGGGGGSCATLLCVFCLYCDNNKMWVGGLNLDLALSVCPTIIGKEEKKKKKRGKGRRGEKW